MGKVVMMECGHAANAVTGPEQLPCCAICGGIHPGAYTVQKQPPLLDGRLARCFYTTCKSKPVPSDTSLAFFEYGRLDMGVRRFDYDTYYCGCHGWE